MTKQKDPAKKNLFERFATWAAHATGSSYAFIGALVLVIGWAASGPIFHYSENWQLVINTSTTIITFLMVFLIQKAQNKDSLATQIKLNELVAANKYTSNRIVFTEGLSEDELIVLSKYYEKLAQLAKNEENLHASRSIDGAEDMHELKKNRRTASNKETQQQTKNATRHNTARTNHSKPVSATKPVSHTTAANTNKAAPAESTTEAKPKSNNRRRRPPRKGPPKASPTAES